MGFNRALIQSPGTPVAARQGAGLLFNILPIVSAADANQTLNVAMMQSGLVQFTGFTAGRNLTTPTGALISAAFPEMDIGDSLSFIVSITTGFAGTWVAGDATVTLAGRATVLANSFQIVVVTRTADSGANRTYSWRAL